MIKPKKVVFSDPPPGSSLTSDNSKWPWGNPPREVDPDKVITMLLDKLERPEMKDKLASLLMAGVSIQVITRGIMLEGFQTGMFSTDVGMLIRRPLAIYLANFAEKLGIPYKFFAQPEKALNRGVNQDDLLKMIAANNPDILRLAKEEMNSILRQGRMAREEQEELDEKSFLAEEK
jgi:hypothetical protein